jgi:hypothetical protein
MTFDTVLDITQQPYPWRYPALGLIFLIVGAVWSLFRWDDPKALRRWSPRFSVGLGAVWMVFGFVSTFSEWSLGRRAVRDRTALVVEGPVENYVPMPSHGRGRERFTIRGVAFSYFANDVSATFKNATYSIWEGRYVRVHYLDNAILKLEVASDMPQ